MDIQSSIKKDNKLNLWDKLLIISIITAPMTSLRIWKIGIAELSIFIWSIRVLLKSRFRIKIDVYIRFFLLFDMCLFLGFVNRVLKNVYTGSALDESLTFLFFNLYVISLSQFLQNTTRKKILKLYKSFFVWGFIIYFGLYLYSIIFSKNLLGYPLWYSNIRLSLLSNNPHQFVFFIGPTALLGLFLIDAKYMISKKIEFIFMLIAIIGYFVMGYLTKSSTLYITLILIFIYIVLFRTIHRVNTRKKVLILGMKILLLMIGFVICFNYILNLFIMFVESDSNGLGRFQLWLLGINQIIKNPFFGLGPGPHLFNFDYFIFLEAHNTYIDIALRAGLIGLTLYLVMLYKSIKNTKLNIYATAIILFFCLYGIAGYSIRRITLWFYIMSISYYCKDVSCKEDIKA